MALDYDGVTSLRLEIKNRLNKTSQQTQADYITEACAALGYDKRKKGDNGAALENKAILQWLLENKTATRNKTQSKSQITLLENIASIEPPKVKDVLPAPFFERGKRRKRFNVAKATKQKIKDVLPIESYLIHSYDATNGAALNDKFISINYRHADNTRHTVRIEQFYIDALKSIGIDDVARFVAENAGVTQVTKNVKAAIVNELVRRASKV